MYLIYKNKCLNENNRKKSLCQQKNIEYVFITC